MSKQHIQPNGAEGKPAVHNKKRKAAWRWFPCYPENWLLDTRELSDTQARVYWDFLCISYLREDGIVREADKWLAYELRCSTQKWRSVKTFLLACGLLVETKCKGIANRRVLEVCNERDQRSNIRARSAETRYRNPRLPFGIKGGGDANADTRARDHHHQQQKKNAPHLRLVDDDDRQPAKLEIAPTLVRALEAHAGQERGAELVAEYLASDYARNAKLIDKAFIGWLRKTYGIVISGAGNAAPNLSDILALCPKDDHGRPTTALPKTVTPAATNDWKSVSRVARRKLLNGEQ